MSVKNYLFNKQLFIESGCNSIKCNQWRTIKNKALGGTQFRGLFTAPIEGGYESH